MAQSSRFWTTDGASPDAPLAGYSADQFAAFLKKAFGDGVLIDIGNELAVSGTETPIQVATGACFGAGYFYENTAVVDLAVASPAATTGLRVVVRFTWATPEGRLAVSLNTDGNPNPPALTQNEGAVYEVNLATGTITSVGVITLSEATKKWGYYSTRLIGLDPDSVDTINLLDEAVEEAKIGALAVTEGKIGALAVTAGKIGALAVTEAKINTGAVTETKLGAVAVTEAKIGTGAVTEAKIGASAVTNTKIGTEAVGTLKIGGFAVTNEKIGGGAVTAFSLGALAVSEEKINTGAVTVNKLGALAVSEAKIAALAVTEGKIGALAVTEAKIGAGAVTVNKLGALAVAEAKINTGAVTVTKIGDQAVTRVKLGDGAARLGYRQGGNASDWNTGGTTQYTVGRCEIQVGSKSWAMTSGEEFVSFNVTFPQDYTLGKPLVFLTIYIYYPAADPVVAINLTSVSLTNFFATIRRLPESSGYALSGEVYWQAIGSDI